MPQTKLALLSIIIFPLIVVLTGCKPELNYAYLMQHPMVLKEEAMRCESTRVQLSDVAVCKVVSRAVYDFSAMMNEQQENPEKFGQRILATETACATAQHDGDQAQVQKQCEEVRVLLAAAGLNSPE